MNDMHVKLRTVCFLMLSFAMTLAISFAAVSQVPEGADVGEIPIPENKALIDKLIVRIDNEALKRELNFIQQGEALTVTGIEGREPPLVTLHEKRLYILVNDCVGLEDVKSWNVLLYPLKINTSVEVDARRPEINLKYILLKNAVVVRDGNSKRCISYADIPKANAFKIEGHKTVGSKQHWSFEKQFSEYPDYLNINRIEEQTKSAPKGSVVCQIATRLCYVNNRKPKYVANLTINGLKSADLNYNSSEEFYVQTRRTAKEVNVQFPKFDLAEIKAPRSIIADFISQNLKHTIVVSVRDNAMRHLQEEDIIELKNLGMDLSQLSVRGAHVSILRPNMAPINVSDNEKLISLSLKDHNVSNLGTVVSAGFAMGDNSLINLGGKNVSPNQRGINIAIIDSKGRLVKAKNFDTHVSPYRSKGLYRVSGNN